MLILNDRAEEKLLDELKICWEKFPATRCLQIKLSTVENEESKNETKGIILESINVFFDDPDLKTYFCADSDLFVTSRILTHKKLKDFLAHIALKLSPALPQGLAALFEIGVDWYRLQSLIKKKIEILKFLEAEKNTKKYETLIKVSRDEAFGTLDRDLISSLAMRRDHRTKPEIMVVEDDVFSQRLVGNALKNQYDLTIVSDGQGAVMTYISKAPDVLFLDIGLPDIDGHTVLKKIFELDPAAYIIMFSGNGDRQNVLKAMDLGSKGFVSKPFTQQKLLHYIEKSPFIQAKKEMKGVV